MVLFGMSLPSESVIHEISMRGQIMPPTDAVELAALVTNPYAYEVWILPIDDTDAVANFDDVWDTLVPKDSDVQALELDEQTADTDVFYEPGETDWKELFDVGLSPQRLKHFHKDLTINNTRGLRFVDSQTPFEPKWQPGDFWQFHSKKSYFVKQPSVLLIGFGIPAGDDTTTDEELPLGQNEWPRVKYLGDTMKMALMDVLGLIETGAETPWEEATDLVQRHLDPDVLENTANFFGSGSLIVFGEMTVRHSVVGELGIVSIPNTR